jgi:hypothetical protein
MWSGVRLGNRLQHQLAKHRSCPIVEIFGVPAGSVVLEQFKELAENGKGFGGLGGKHRGPHSIRYRFLHLDISL